MISQELQQKFKLLEMAALPAYLAVGAKERKRIVRNIAKWEAQEIIKEINHAALNLK